MILDILTYPHSALTEVAEPVTDFDEELAKLVEDMAETMYAYKGIGLAGPQVGVNKRLFVMDVGEGEGLRVFINPEVTKTSTELRQVEEGCLSFPGFFETVSRFTWIEVRAQGVDGEVFELRLEGLPSQCVEHETEHLDGHVLVDNVGRLSRRLITKSLQKRKKKIARATRRAR